MAMDAMIAHMPCWKAKAAARHPPPIAPTMADARNIVSLLYLSAAHPAGKAANICITTRQLKHCEDTAPLLLSKSLGCW
jgi:hypothetical protein